MKKSFIKKFLVFSLTCVLALGTISGSVFAKNRDFYDASNKKIYASPATMSDADFANFIDALSDHGDQFVYEFGGKYYSYENFVNEYMQKVTQGSSSSEAFTACLGDNANIKAGFDASAYGTQTDPTTSDFSVISID